MESKMIILEECASTNSAIPADAPHGFAVMARRQSAGRGQRGSSWESEPGRNVTMSVLLRPADIDVANQFSISIAAALAVAETLDHYGIAGAQVKWPNDIYVGNSKICGILIENSLSGRRIARSIVGIGLNVNQREFHSPAPNPVSMAQLTGSEYSIEEIAHTILARIMRIIDTPVTHTAAIYRSRLWRGTGIWPWVTADGTRFNGAIEDVRPTGHIVIGRRSFAFKEVWPADLRDPSHH